MNTIAAHRPRAASLWIAAGALALFVAALATALSAPAAEVLARASAFYLMALPIVLLAIPGTRQRATEWIARPGAAWCYGAALFAAVACDRLVRGSTEQIAMTALYVAVALAMSRGAGDRPRALDILLVAWLWLPLEMGWVSGDFVLLRLLGVNLLILLFVVERPIWSLGNLVPRNRREWGWGLGMWLAFIALAIPAAHVSGFATLGLSQRSGGDWALFVVSTFLIIALPEEALFRGTIQGLLARATARPWFAWVVASLLFGASHLNNEIQGSIADMRYLVLSSIAGLAYGLAYIKTGNIAAPTMTHFLVDVTWRGLFTGSD